MKMQNYQYNIIQEPKFIQLSILLEENNNNNNIEAANEIDVISKSLYKRYKISCISSIKKCHEILYQYLEKLADDEKYNMKHKNRLIVFPTNISIKKMIQQKSNINIYLLFLKIFHKYQSKFIHTGIKTVIKYCFQYSNKQVLEKIINCIQSHYSIYKNRLDESICYYIYYYDNKYIELLPTNISLSECFRGAVMSKNNKEITNLIQQLKEIPCNSHYTLRVYHESIIKIAVLCNVSIDILDTICSISNDNCHLYIICYKLACKFYKPYVLDWIIDNQKILSPRTYIGFLQSEDYNPQTLNYLVKVKNCPVSFVDLVWTDNSDFFLELLFYYEITLRDYHNVYKSVNIYSLENFIKRHPDWKIINRNGLNKRIILSNTMRLSTAVEQQILTFTFTQYVDTIQHYQKTLINSLINVHKLPEVLSKHIMYHY